MYSIYEFLEKNSWSIDLADKFINDLYESIYKNLSVMPQKYPVYKDEVRKYVYPENSNYIIFFEIKEITYEVYIYAITNSKQYSRYIKL